MRARLFTKQKQEASVNDVMPQAPIQPNDPAAGNSAGRLVVTRPSGLAGDTAGFVTRMPRQNLTHLYSYGMQTRQQFPMRMTGGVESTKFEPYNGVMVNADFNNSLHEGACWPTMTGISFKVQHVPNELLAGTAGATMQPQQQQRRSIFTNRNFSVAPSLPAKPASS